MKKLYTSYSGHDYLSLQLSFGMNSLELFELSENEHGTGYYLMAPDSYNDDLEDSRPHLYHILYQTLLQLQIKEAMSRTIGR